MITNLRFQHFKSWNDTGELRFAPLTGFFGSNSSGKTAILRFLLMLKQTVESNDQQLVLNLNGGYVELGSFEDVIYQHNVEQKLDFDISMDIENLQVNFSEIFGINLESAIRYKNESPSITRNIYTFFKKDKSVYQNYEIVEFDENYTYTDKQENILIEKKKPYFTSKFYTLPHDFVHPSILSAGKISIIALQYFIQNFEEHFRDMQYLGPIREDPKRFYQWTGEIRSLGNRGEHAVLVLLADQKRYSESRLAKQVAIWLKQLGLIADFRLHQIAPNVDLHEVRVKIKPNAAEVLLTDVGFGVAQILPVLVLCASAKPGSTIILEQPEIYLHPAVQSNLADILIETIKRGVQIVLESHSEHLLHRLQRRIAEEVLSNTDTALYFCDMDDTGTSHAVPLDVDQYGNIRNWPKDFFGDEMADLAALSRETIRRKKAEAGR
ncbi:DUF3696 domain-containing protein [Herpetosiphon sp. NSE202]|uniref:DUF3696 domain-containing protein n=1 Tax=Herpetosiphon sp. NSE202 TaxID=3351349 RepID=UPI00363C2342